MRPYSSTLADHFNSPRNVGAIEAPDSVGHASLNGRAPRMVMYLKVRDSKVERLTFHTFGCGFSIAACSALTEMAQGSQLQQCMSISADDLITALDGMPDHKRFCAELAVNALRDAIKQLSNQ